MSEDQKLVQTCVSMADDVLHSYQFGEGVTVVEQDNWNTDDKNDFTKIVYVHYDDDLQDADSHKVSFHVQFKMDGTIEEVYGLEIDSGNYIGQYGKAFCQNIFQK